MTVHLQLLAVDPGLAATGYVLVGFDPSEVLHAPEGSLRDVVHPLLAGVIRTKPEPKKGMAKVRKCDVTADRVWYIGKELHSIITLRMGDGSAMAWEAFTPGGRPGVGGMILSAASFQTLAVVGSVTTLAMVHGLPYFAVHPSETKRLVTGIQVSSKEAVYSMVQARLEAVVHFPHKWPAGCNEHVGDAYAVALAGALRWARTATVVGV